MAEISDDDDPCEFIRDTELAAIAAIVAALDSLPDPGDQATSGAPWRVLTYVASRCGFVLCTED